MIDKVIAKKNSRYRTVEEFNKVKAMAIRLRKAGAANSEISCLIKVQQNTISNWVKNQKISLLQQQDLLFRTQSLRHWKKRLKFQVEGRELAQQGIPLHAQGCMLYWAEGTKGGSCLGFTNSDPKMIALFLAFLRRHWEIPSNKISMRLSYYTGNGVHEDEIIQFWLNTTNLSSNHLRKHQVNTIPKSSKSKQKGKLLYGVCHINVHDFQIKEHIKGAVAEYVKQANPDLDTRTTEEIKVEKALQQLEEFKKIVSA